MTQQRSPVRLPRLLLRSRIEPVETVLSTILTNAGFAGALLAVCGWALWKKDGQVKELQAAAVAREKELGEKHLERVERLTAEYTSKIGASYEARTADLTRVLEESEERNEKATDVLLAVNTTLVQMNGVLTEVRADVRRRRNGASIPPGGGGA